MKVYNVKPTKAWFCFDESLELIGERLFDSGIIDKYDFDMENVYEWIETSPSSSGVKLNFSRQHLDGYNIKNEPISLLLVFSEKEPENSTLEKLADSIAKELSVEVCIGEIEHLEDDNYKYHVQKKIGS